ncbi:MAG TPA: TIGR03087 family PEP-CTERM/XrtA system glycosyltransferase [Burkholderiales bacterium]|nr:TIGR03087 family PEP-CTERM/XrtA system glycosyltransferase [Burkholderiales bacterium]
MEALLYLVHRIPYPPNKGDKLRSYHLLRCLARHYRVYLGSFIDHPADRQYADEVRAMCTDAYLPELHPRMAKLKSAAGLLSGQALTLPYYSDVGMRRWVEETIRAQKINKAVVFSSAMAQYVEGREDLRTIVDFVDVDSQKWQHYAPRHVWPMSAVYSREADRLLAYERKIARETQASVFVTPEECALFNSLAPESVSKVHSARNGVDTSYFSPDHALPSPYVSDEEVVVFTGAMDYWPNIDAVTWFVESILPSLRARRPQLRFYIVGMNPSPAVKALAAQAGVVVTGTVPDIRPYLRHARVSVAPLRVARGIQNKTLEAMAMETPVVATTRVGEVLGAVPETEVLMAADEREFGDAIEKLLSNPERAARMGAAARTRVLNDYNWEKNLEVVHELLEGRTSSNLNHSALPAEAQA